MHEKYNYTITKDGYISIGEFDIDGVAQGSVSKQLGKIQELRLTVHSESGNWAILSEVSIHKNFSYIKLRKNR
ncbi:GSCOCG00011594001-RA-CDS [Cotesia congregata]|nr:GSCOCG00011594001-RA-CDS [Cotesia congregata]